MSQNPPLQKFRASQQTIINYSGGLLGVSAVPGAGKTFTLSHLAAALVQRLSTASVIDEQEVLIVTFSNSAVNSFKQRIAAILRQERGMLPYTGYRVRTLHGLAHDIVRERPNVVGLVEDFQIIDEQQSLKILQSAIHTNLSEWETRLERFLKTDITEGQQKYIYNRALPEAMLSLIRGFISRAKENNWTAHMLEMAMEEAGRDFDLARFASRVYGDYQRSLAYRGVVDFDDLIRFARQALDTDTHYLERLQRRWPYVLEDEAQDSSHLQEALLRLLTGERNWVRVGDPNQAINTTFTTANPEFLRRFLDDKNVRNQPLQESGRSSLKIIGLANELIRWTTQQHPIPSLRDAFYPQDIIPTGPNDPQQNPPVTESGVYIHNLQQQLSPEKELELVVDSLQKWLPENPDKTVAVLVPENIRGFHVAEALKKAALPYEELLRSTSQTRQAAALLTLILQYLNDPKQSRLLVRVYREVWLPLRQGRTILPPSSVSASALREELEAVGRFGEAGEEFTDTAIYDDETGEIESDEIEPAQRLAKALLNLREVETLLAPVDESDWEDLFERLKLDELPDEWLDDLLQFVSVMQRWLKALRLPIDQMILTIGQDIFHHAADIALAYKIATLLKGVAVANPQAHLVDFISELRLISENQRRFIGFDDAETGYEPPRGRITIATMHAAKGLEWDRVYLMSVNNYSFPSAATYDQYIGERWFARDGLNLDSEVLAQLEAITQNNLRGYQLGTASEQARLDYAAERLRLLYVGITRAREDLIITWNIGRYGEKSDNQRKLPAVPLFNLKEWLHDQQFED
jgi:DNA helicase-2/ATP-dependent DNA helicase PcrA